MIAMAFQITSLTIVYSRRRSKKTSKLRVTGLCEGSSPVTGEFPAQRASNAEMFPFDDVIMTILSAPDDALGFSILLSFSNSFSFTGVKKNILFTQFEEYLLYFVPQFGIKGWR